MLHILFVPGTFATTIEYSLRMFCRAYKNTRHELPQLIGAITNDGSMHGYTKQAHYGSKVHLDDLLNGTVSIVDDIVIADPIKSEITTPLYPMVDFHADEVINFFKTNFSTDKCVFVYIDNIEYAEINMLFQYYKMAKGVLNLTLGVVFCGNNAHNITSWNTNYTHWSDMQTWELREWLSIFYPKWAEEWIDAVNYADPSWLLVRSKDILDNPQKTFREIIDYSGGIDPEFNSEFNEFTKQWSIKQQYVLDEYSLIKKIVQTTISNELFRWDQLNIISESMIQQHLRANGYEIKCHNLNTFPRSSIELHNLLERI